MFEKIEKEKPCEELVEIKFEEKSIILKKNYNLL